MADPDAYAAAVKKGKALMAAMQASPDSPSGLSQPSRWTSYEDLQKHGWTRDEFEEANVYGTDVSAELTEVMKKFNVSLGPSNNIQICWKHTETTTHDKIKYEATLTSHEQLYNIASGTIIAIDITSPAETVKSRMKDFGIKSLPSDHPVLQHWSDITFLQWQALTSTPPIPETTFQPLKYVMHRKVSNRNTQAIIKTVLAKRGKVETREVIPWVETYTAEDGDDFLALLGSPNGFGTGFLLAQHKKELGWKDVKSISVHQVEQRVLVLEVGDVSPSQKSA